MNNQTAYLNLLVAFMQLVSLRETPLESATASELRRYLQPFGRLLMLAVGQEGCTPLDIRLCCREVDISVYDFYEIVAVFVEREQVADTLPICARLAYATAKTRYYEDHPDRRSPKPASQMLKASINARMKEAHDGESQVPNLSDED